MIRIQQEVCDGQNSKDIHDVKIDMCDKTVRLSFNATRDKHDEGCYLSLTLDKSGLEQLAGYINQLPNKLTNKEEV